MERIRTDIEGLDEMIGGGVPEGMILAILGSCGTGKTTLTLQFIWNGLRNGQKGIFISLEEDEDSVKKNAGSYGWDLQPYLDDKTLTLVKLEPADAKTTINRIKSELPEYIRTTGVKRVVFDSVSLLSMMFDNESEQIGHCRHTVVHHFTDWPTGPRRTLNGFAQRRGLRHGAR